MPYSHEHGLVVHGRGKTNRAVVLNEIKEAREEVQKIAQALVKLEALVLSQPEGGPTKLENLMATPIVTNYDLKPLLGWILSLYESFYLIGAVGVGGVYAKNAASWFSNSITKINHLAVSIPK
jgi:hypothetical protein